MCLGATFEAFLYRLEALNLTAMKEIYDLCRWGYFRMHFSPHDDSAF